MTNIISPTGQLSENAKITLRKLQLKKRPSLRIYLLMQDHDSAQLSEEAYNKIYTREVVNYYKRQKLELILRSFLSLAYIGFILYVITA